MKVGRRMTPSPPPWLGIRSMLACRRRRRYTPACLRDRAWKGMPGRDCLSDHLL